MGHNHNHHESVSNLKLAFFLTLIFTIIEFIGGFYVNSIAIISDAVHDLGDSLSLGTAWYLQNKSKKKADSKFSFGYARFSLLGALINSLILVIGSVYVLSEAVERFMHPEASDAKGMIVFAIIGILVNGYAAWKVSHGHSLNEKVISWHLLEDVLGWFVILVGAIVLLFKDLPYLDPALSVFITLFILYNVFKNLKATLFIFLQGIPSDIIPEQIESEICKIENVHSVHNIRIWSLEGEHHVFSCHVKLKNISSMDQLLEIKSKIKNILAHYPFKDYTIETELDIESCGLPKINNSSHAHKHH